MYPPPLCPAACSVVLHLLHSHDGSSAAPPPPPQRLTAGPRRWYAVDTAGQRDRAAAGVGGVARFSLDAVALLAGAGSGGGAGDGGGGREGGVGGGRVAEPDPLAHDCSNSSGGSSCGSGSGGMGLRLWSAEDPHLYVLVLELRRDAGGSSSSSSNNSSSGNTTTAAAAPAAAAPAVAAAAVAEAEVLEYESCQLGFRHTESRGAVLRHNGRPVMLRGVNRHEWDHRWGRVYRCACVWAWAWAWAWAGVGVFKCLCLLFGCLVYRTQHTCTLCSLR